MTARFLGGGAERKSWLCRTGRRITSILSTLLWFSATHFGLPLMHQTTCAIVPAAGRGLRMGMNTPKQFLKLSGQSVVARTVEALAAAPFLSGLFLVVPEDFLPAAREIADSMATRLRPGCEITILAGGVLRQDSVFNALSRLPADCQWVLIHDGVRPFVSKDLLKRTLRGASHTGACIAALPATDTVKRVRGESVLETLPRDEIWLVQTPQVFRRDLLLEAYEEARRQGWEVTDDASLVERLGYSVTVVSGERTNIKLTTPEDLEWAAWRLSRFPHPGEGRGPERTERTEGTQKTGFGILAE